MKKRLTGVAGLLFTIAACSTSGGAASVDSTQPPASRAPRGLTVTSTLDGHSELPHRIPWVATPSSTDVSEVDFLVDGKQLWVEHNAPYYYGDDGNYLVTSFLKPGLHTFTVRAIALDGTSATDAVTATVSSPPPPPAALIGTWKAVDPQDHRFHALVINSVGWVWDDYPPDNADGNGALLDVAYLRPGLLEVRTGIATGHDEHNGWPVDADLNGWCNDAPGSPVRMRWSVSGNRLRLRFLSGRPCEGFRTDMTVAWRKAG